VRSPRSNQNKLLKEIGLYNAYVPDGGNEGSKVAIPTSISIFISYEVKIL
jgi:hypothetical protein